MPVLRNVDRMTVAQIARELNAMAEKARTARFAVEELRGGTFTISNMGAVGGAYSTPIINYPEVAILLWAARAGCRPFGMGRFSLATFCH